MNYTLIQKAFNLPLTGELDDLTRAAIRNFQMKHGLIASGVLDTATVAALDLNPDADGDLDSDLFGKSDFVIHQKFLREGEYRLGGNPKRFIFLHHTAGWNNPYQVVDMWEKDQRGPVGTHYVIGGPSPKDGNDKYDGEIVQCISHDGYGWHLGIGGTAVHKESIGIELCNFGWLTKDWSYENPRTLTGKIKRPKGFYTYTGMKVDNSQVIDLGYEFRGYQYWHKYSDKQLQSLKFLLKKLCIELSINIYSGLHERLISDPLTAFDYDSKIQQGTFSRTGIFTHTNVIKSGKWDLSPQPNVIQMITTI